MIVFVSLDINECIDTNICLNGGFCMNTQGSYQCQCAPGWTGPTCSIGKYILDCDVRLTNIDETFPERSIAGTNVYNQITLRTEALSI